MTSSGKDEPVIGLSITFPKDVYTQEDTQIIMTAVRRVQISRKLGPFRDISDYDRAALLEAMEDDTNG